MSPFFIRLKKVAAKSGILTNKDVYLGLTKTLNTRLRKFNWYLLKLPLKKKNDYIAWKLHSSFCPGILTKYLTATSHSIISL